MTRREQPTTWVIGAGGLLGRAITAEVGRRVLPVHTAAVPWHDSAAALSELSETAEWLISTNAAVDVVWCAGAAVVGSTPEVLGEELAVYRGFLLSLAEARRRHTSTAVRAFLSSSAGGVYAGSIGPPFTEADAPRPLAPYGITKLAMERAAAVFAADSGTPVYIGRMANLYGPGQRLAKPQGIVSQLCRSQLTRQPLSIYVSLDTARDYLYVADAARMVLGGLDLMRRESLGSVVTKILCSGTSTTLAEVVGTLHRISKRRPPVVLGLSRQARFQPPDLRFRSIVWPELNALATTPLPVGMAATLRDVASLGHHLRRGVRVG